ncbi:MAG: S8 family serine peptidase, partial [Deltaproteobacteria bacterium]|nr:S8 family serine peptidase [Deltaproteobacteria bacterium]
RVTEIIDVAGDGPQDVNSGHGTHVAGSVLGNGILSGSTPSSNTFPGTCFAGIAPKASLVFQAVENNSTQGLSLPSDLNTLFSQSDSAGADLHTNSWGASAGGMYSSYSQDVDEYIWDHKDFMILFSAGNEGIDMDGDGVIDLNSLGAPATAKNCLTVGASEGNRPSGSGYDSNWGTLWPNDFSATPISTDHVSNNSIGMAAFSSRGPVIDGRYKPDLVAPGTNILSARSSMASGTGWGAYNSNYLWMGGTSMSTPLTAGASALMREYLIKVQGYTTPSAALIKAALLNSAEDISPGQYGTGIDQEIPDAPVPNNVEGWGRLNIENGVYPSSPFNILYYDESTGLNTSGYNDYTVDISAAGSPLKINLVWTDYPGSTAAQGGLVNDLDLQVTDPSMSVHYPDNSSQKSTASQLSYDNDNFLYWYNSNRQAIKFTPSSYPAYVESTTFYFYNQLSTAATVNVVVYNDNGGLPGTPLFTKTLTYVPTGWATIGISGVTIASGDFYIAVETTTTSQGLLIDDTNPTGRSYYHTGSAWATSSFTSYIRANVRGIDHSTSFDRVNNVLGLSLSSAAAGTYTIRVSGYNVPQGPQPYALVVSGQAPDTDPPSIVEYPSINFDNNTIDIAYDEPILLLPVRRMMI